jgi:hypothetical protein
LKTIADITALTKLDNLRRKRKRTATYIAILNFCPYKNALEKKIEYKEK